jgi:hypothetical protein
MPVGVKTVPQVDAVWALGNLCVQDKMSVGKTAFVARGMLLSSRSQWRARNRESLK